MDTYGTMLGPAKGFSRPHGEGTLVSPLTFPNGPPQQCIRWPHSGVTSWRKIREFNNPTAKLSVAQLPLVQLMHAKLQRVV